MAHLHPASHVLSSKSNFPKKKKIRLNLIFRKFDCELELKIVLRWGVVISLFLGLGTSLKTTIIVEDE